MKLTLIDNEHGFDKKGRLYVLVDGKWVRATSDDQDREWWEGIEELEMYE